RVRRPRRGPCARVGTRAPPGESWPWSLADGAPPAADALAHQLETVEASPNTAAVGAKRVRHSDPEPAAPAHLQGDAALVDVGLTLTHSARLITGVAPGAIDQRRPDWARALPEVAR